MKRSMRQLLFIACLGLLSLGAGTVLRAAQLGLDPTFGNGGTAITDLGSNESVAEVVEQADGKLVAGGSAGEEANLNFALLRHNTDGSLDSSFGIDGVVLSDFGGDNDTLTALALDSAGGIMAAGSSGTSPSSDFRIARYLPDGMIDATFGISGTMTTDFGGYDSAQDMLVQPDGKFVLVGYTGERPMTDLAMTRYNADGTLDTSFGEEGKVILNVADEDFGVSVKRQEDGKLLVAGTTGLYSGWDFLLVRFNEDGSLDGSFGSGGIVQTSFTKHFDVAFDIELQSDGKIVVAGLTEFTTALARYHPDGTLDTSFGEAGLVMSSFGKGASRAFALEVGVDDSLVIAGSLETFTLDDIDGLLARYLPDGTLDETFGTGGAIVTDVNETINTFRTLVHTADNKWVTGGGVGPFGTSDFVVARFAEGFPPPNLDHQLFMPIVHK